MRRFRSVSSVCCRAQLRCLTRAATRLRMLCDQGSSRGLRVRAVPLPASCVGEKTLRATQITCPLRVCSQPTFGSILTDFDNVSVYPMPLGVCDRRRTTTGEGGIYPGHIATAEEWTGATVGLRGRRQQPNHNFTRAYNARSSSLTR